MNIFKYQKQSLDLISKSMGLPTFDEMLEDPHGEFTDKATKEAEEAEDERIAHEEADENVLGENMVGDPRRKNYD